jgi:hypothetical protein
MHGRLVWIVLIAMVGPPLTTTASYMKAQQAILPEIPMAHFLLRIYTKAIDLTCCTHPESPECQSGSPTVSAGTPSSMIYINGQECIEE